MAEFVCQACGIDVDVIGAPAPPADSLCAECRVIAEAAPEDRAALARVFGKEPRAC
jgi:hypothetical protein